MRRLLPIDTDAGLFLLRAGLAVIFLYHGVPKILDLPGTIRSFEGMGIPGPALTATIATIVEAPAGLAMLLGVGVEIAGVLMAMVLVGAILTFHLPNGFYFGANGFEYQFFLTVAALAVAVTGPGAYALGRRKTS